MMETYDAYKGAKAEEEMKRAQEYLEQIEEGQRQNAIVLKKLQERIENAKEHKIELSEIKKEYNENIWPLKAVKAQEIMEQRSLNVLQKNYDIDIKTQKYLAQLQKQEKAAKQKMDEIWQGKVMKVNT